jgi:hypothetical protein
MDYVTSATLNRQRFEREYVYDNLALLRTSYDSFIADLPVKTAAARINARIESQLNAFMAENRLRLFPEAIEVYRESLAQGYPVRLFGSQLDYASSYNANGYLSFFFDRYEYAGGAHGTTIRRSDTCELSTGQVLPLPAFFPRGYPYLKTILESILDEARNRNADDPVYFENYEELILKYFDPGSYYLTPEGIAFYFQQYEIAPYAAGIIVFIVPYKLLGLDRLYIDNPPASKPVVPAEEGRSPSPSGQEPEAQSGRDSKSGFAIQTE